MKRFFKYGVIPVVTAVFLFCITLMLLPVLINVQKFLPQIEKQVSQTTGRQFQVGSDFGLTFFPWLSVTFSDLRLGNPEDMDADDFVKIDSFEARVKLLPLLANKVEVSRFVVSGLNFHLLSDENGKNNWELFPEKKAGGSNPSRWSFLNWLFSRDVAIELFAVTGGSLRWDDKAHQKEHQLDDMMVLLNNVSSVGKATVDFKGTSDGHLIRGAGTIGPVSSQLSSLFMDLRLNLNDRMMAMVTGDCSYPLAKTQCDLNINIPPFSLAEFYSITGQPSSINAVSDNGGEEFLTFAGHFNGNRQKFTVDSGSGSVGNTSFTYTLNHDSVGEVSNMIEMTFDRLNLDHYFAGKSQVREPVESETPGSVLQSLQTLPFDARVKGEVLTLANLPFHGIAMDIHAEKGAWQVMDGSFALYGGSGVFDASVGVTQQPVSLQCNLELQDISSELLSQGLIGTPFLTGQMKGNIALRRTGTVGEGLEKAYAGNGIIEIDNGTVTGIDLLATSSEENSGKTYFTRLSTDFISESGFLRFKPLTLVLPGNTRDLQAIVDFEASSFTVSPLSGDNTDGENDVLSLSGSYDGAGLAVDGFTGVHETKIIDLRDAQALVDEKMPLPVEEDIENISGTPLIDPAIVAQRFGLKPEAITRDKVKKAFDVGKGRVKIHPLQELDKADFSQ
ncbi:AsmA family protein [Desulforhopalus sp. IMCC35007]|uniref:AsmA family protein n=1 Tax=Desulforhopalus sp. IMCC35007 TaxID=2569543 RepID=UPI0010AE4345|nr:AsmA family protein [Desulforhopalus sp. IMCC35007]TKB10709.1 AsmA family protein [Desulforhopalus sp. IMCC35007]